MPTCKGNWVNGIITAVHAASKGENFYNRDGKFIENCTLSQIGGTIDAAFIPFTDQADWDVSSCPRGKGPWTIDSFTKVYDKDKAANRNIDKISDV